MSDKTHHLRAPISIIIFTSLLIFLSSCQGTQPSSCFVVKNNIDSIRVGDTVRFEAYCSANIDGFYWSFGNRKDAQYGVTAATTYDSAITYQVTLLVSNGRNTSNSSKLIHVNK